MKKVYGIAISPGIGVGTASVWGKTPRTKRRKISVSQITSELERFSYAVRRSEEQVSDLQKRVARGIGHKEAEIFEVHALLLKDPGFIAQIEKKILEKRVNAESALEEVVEESTKLYSSVNDVYLKERIQDIRDIGKRILENLIGQNQKLILNGETEIIVVAEELTPSQLIDIDHNLIKGFITERGGETSHSAILARSLGIPLISGVQDVLKKIKVGCRLLVNGFNGEIIRNPLQKEIDRSEREFPRMVISDSELKCLNQQETATEDGIVVHLHANIRSQGDLNYAQHFHAEGIGLYRTEMAFMNRDDFPSEEEQFTIYREVVESIAPHHAVIRTLDLGGDKFSPYHPYVKNREMNPYLGLRAIRISLSNPKIFRKQLRAILRASAFGKVKLMMPMISGLEEIKHTKRLLLKEMKDLENSDIPYDANLEIGVMIEIPSAVIVIDAILREVDFISVGTNDLIQYTLAVDRSNELVSRYYEALHPAILHSLEKIVNAADRSGKEVSICGEMAGDVKYTELLVGLGYRNLSMSAFFIPQVKKALRAINIGDAQKLAQEALQLSEIRKIRKLINHRHIQAIHR
jgi:phosphotransferase system enzyme I (PtsI)